MTDSGPVEPEGGMRSEVVTRPFLITGCGRSGTGWAAALFTVLGYPTGHEAQFNCDKAGPLEGSESSWLAVPHLDDLPQGTRVLRIMRNPYKVVQSIMARGFLRDGHDPYDMYVDHHRPEITGAADYLGRAIRYVALWDEPVAGWNVLRVDGTTHQATGAARYATGARLSRSDVGQARRAVGTVVNATSPGPILPVPSVDQIEDHPDGTLIITRAEQFGYA